MRICLVSREYPPDTGWGGIGTYTFHHARALKEAGHDVEVIALAKKEIRTPPPEPYGQNDAEAVPVHRVVWQPLLQEIPAVIASIPHAHRILQSCMALGQKFFSLHAIKPFDVVEAPEHLAEGLFPAITHICPLVIRLHTPHSKMVRERYHTLTASFDNRLIAILERMAMGQADLLSSPSLDLARYVSSDCGMDLSAMKIVRNPVDTDKFTPDGIKAIPDDGRVTVFFAGRLEARKGIHYLIKAIPLVLAECPHVRFIVAGADTNTEAGHKSVLNKLKMELSASRCLDAVRFINHVPLDDMPAYYRSADICVVPSLYENAPYTIIEAQASGKPVVGTSAGGSPEYINDGETGIVVAPQDPYALSEAIIALAIDKARRRSMGAMARRKAVAEFKTSVIVREAVDTYLLAIRKFRESHNLSLYRKAPQESLSDCISLMYAYHKNLSDVMYRCSLGWRLKYWIGLALNQPGLCAEKFARVILKIACSVFRVTPGNNPQLLQILESRIAQRESERDDSVVRELMRACAFNQDETQYNRSSELSGKGCFANNR